MPSKINLSNSNDKGVYFRNILTKIKFVSLRFWAEKTDRRNSSRSLIDKVIKVLIDTQENEKTKPYIIKNYMGKNNLN